MYDVKNLNIWKTVETKNNSDQMFLNAEITELNLSVRSFNCLKRANCNTIRDIMNCMGEEGQGLRKIRNLGNRSEIEIKERIEEYRNFCATQSKSVENRPTIIRPAKKVWDRRIDEFNVSQRTLVHLRSCGINTIGDLYVQKIKEEPGWYAVRELFNVVPSSR